jgi:streptogramin lyase
MYSQEKMNLSSHLKQPKSLVINSVGEMYICNTLSHSIEKYNPFNESVSTIAENLNFPQNIALDQSGNIFITDSFSKSIKK